MTAADASKDPEIVSKKMDELKNQGTILSKALFKHMDKVSTKKAFFFLRSEEL